MNTSGDDNAELESFREQWRQEVFARNTSGSSQQPASGNSLGPSARRSYRPSEGPPRLTTRKKSVIPDEDDDKIQPRSFDETETNPASSSKEQDYSRNSKSKEPLTALDHYEQAVEKEAIGKLGDSVRLYRKAYKMDDAVDQKYKSKHFPQATASLSTQAASMAGAAAPGTAEPDTQILSMNDLIASFAGLHIEPALPEIDGMPQPSCPMAELPEEILVHILQEVAISDVADFVRLSQVCKRFAYLVATESSIWRRICFGHEVGFDAMHYYWQKQPSWDDLTQEELLREATEAEAEADTGAQSKEKAKDDVFALSRAERHIRLNQAVTKTLFSSLYGSSWQRMFRQRPRVRFNGCYISTVNYQRHGEASGYQAAWNNGPVHIVTYYRYLRFFRDGTVITLVSTTEPTEVVPHLTRDALALHAGSARAPHLPSAVMKYGQRGRWRLARTADNPLAGAEDLEGDLFVEMEGVTNHIFRMDLTFRTAGKGAKNNKLVWKGFYIYDRLTDDWADFGTKHYRPWFFSRVKSYGAGA